MPIEFNCEACARLLRVPDGTQGKQCQCPGCGVLLRIPSQTTAALPVAGNLPEVAICIACPKCRHELICDPSLIGTKGQCRNCKHIFIITEDPIQAATPVDPGWIFNCPKCDQLFEGNESMRGRRGKCHVCGEVFAIQLKMVGDTSPLQVDASHPTAKSVPVAKPEIKVATKQAPATTPVQSKTPAANTTTPKSPSPSEAGVPSSTNSQIPNLPPTRTTATNPKAASAEPVAAAKVTQHNRRLDAGTTPQKVPINLSPIRFQCKSCNGTLEVSGDSVGQVTFCPFCQEQLEVPSADEKAASTLPVNNGIFDTSLDPFATTSGLGALDDLPPMQSVGVRPAMGRSRSTSRSLPTKYIACGVATLVCALLSMVVELYQIALALQRAGTTMDSAERLAASFVAVCIGMAFCVAMVQVVGGIAMMRGRGLILARAASILNLMPCICINFPIGIWGTVLTFSSQAKNDFNS